MLEEARSHMQPFLVQLRSVPTEERVVSNAINYLPYPASGRYYRRRRLGWAFLAQQGLDATPMESPHFSENIENYLEQILRISKKSGGHAKTGEVAKNLKVAPSSVTEMLAKLEKMGFVRHTAYKGVELTEPGYFRALDVLKRHTIAERFLEEIVGMEHTQAHDWGCRMEHVLPPELEQWIMRELGKRDTKA